MVYNIIRCEHIFLLNEVNNMDNTIEKLREKLHLMLNSDEYNYEEILKVSQQLDKLIVDYYNLQLAH